VKALTKMTNCRPTFTAKKVDQKLFSGALRRTGAPLSRRAGAPPSTFKYVLASLYVVDVHCFTLRLKQFRNSFETVLLQFHFSVRTGQFTTAVAMLNLALLSLWPTDFLLPVPYLWLTSDHFVGKWSSMGQPSRQTQPSIHPQSVH